MHKRLELRQAVTDLLKRFPELRQRRLTDSDLVDIDNGKEKETNDSRRTHGSNASTQQAERTDTNNRQAVRKDSEDA